jgi:hypothetical protein
MRLAEPRDGELAGVLVVLGGPVVWGFLYGSDIAPLTFLALWLLERMLAEWERPVPWGIITAAALIALTRPEGLALALLLSAALTFLRAVRTSLQKRLLSWLPVAAGLAVLTLNRWYTGAWLGTSVSHKSLLAAYGLGDSLGLVAAYGQDVLRGLLLGVYPSQAPVGFSEGFSPYFLPPLGLLLMLIAVASPRREARVPLWVYCGIVVALFALLAPNTFMGVHFNRYLLWAFPAFLVLAAVGLGVLARGLARGDAARERTYYRIGAAVCLLSGALSTLRFAAVYADMTGSVFRRDIAAARWIAENLPESVTIANVATSVEYLTGHRNVNLHGVTTPAFFGSHKAEREAAMLESLARLPVAERPPYLISTVSSQRGFPVLEELVEQPPLFQTTSFSDEIQIFRMRYDAVGHADRPRREAVLAAVRGLVEVDRLNVCDVQDEARHRYRFRSQIGNVRLHGTARSAELAGPGGSERLVDAGRAIFGEEVFEIDTRPGRALNVVMRTAASLDVNVLRPTTSGRFRLDLGEAHVRVALDGAPAVSAVFTPRAGWDELLLQLPAAAVTSECSTLRVSGRYASFRYWFYQ